MIADILKPKSKDEIKGRLLNLLVLYNTVDEFKKTNFYKLNTSTINRLNKICKLINSKPKDTYIISFHHIIANIVFKHFRTNIDRFTIYSYAFVNKQDNYAIIKRLNGLKEDSIIVSRENLLKVICK